MKKKELKFLCVGMCVCTVLAAGNAVAVARHEKIQTEENLNEAQEIVEVSETEETHGAGAEQYEIYRVGSGNEMEIEEVKTEEEAETPEESNLIIADVTNYVNIRSLPSEEGEILGKLYDNSVGRRYGEENGWYYIESGKVKGYVKAEFVLNGEVAESRAKEVGTRLAEVVTTTLKVRKDPATDAAVLGLVPGGDILNVLEEMEDWIKVDTEEGTGYVSADYVNVYTENVEAESREEEAARLKKEEEERKKAESAAKEALKQQQMNKPAQDDSNNIGSNTNIGSVTNTGNNTNSAGGTADGYTENGTDLGRAIADYAMQFIGNPYVYGGTSLTNGADCSGFVQSVYKHFGISLPRTSGEQGKAGRAVEGLANAVAGDLVWYSGHIGIYIGNGKVVHASNPKNGIITSEATYRTILGIRRIV